MFKTKKSTGLLYAVGFLAMLSFAACSSTTTTTPPTTTSSMYLVTNVVADTAGYGAGIIDKTLANAWGISIGTQGNFWLSSNHGGGTNIYNGAGATLLAAIKVPSRDGVSDGSPTGVVFNPTSTDFKGNNFIYCTEDGIIAAWNFSGGMTKVATDPSADAVYKGMALASDGTANFLYVADFKQGKIIVYDKNFAPVIKTFSDPSIPSGYAPFNVANIGGMLYVAYAKQHTPPDNDDQSGGGNGYISIFKPDGTFVSRFASNGVLNSPWGIAQAPAAFGDFSNAVLVGNFGDGKINEFDSTGKSLGPLKDANGAAISIEGLWGIMSFGAIPPVNVIANSLYFTSGPAGESHGIFGYIKLK